MEKHSNFTAAKRIAFQAVAASLVLLASAAAANPFDGRYHGAMNLLRGTASWCENPKDETLTVADNRLSMHYGNAPVQADIGADGNFSAATQYKRHGLVKLNGHILGDTLEATLEGNTCDYHYLLRKIP
jgi:hypothetical protein